MDALKKIWHTAKQIIRLAVFLSVGIFLLQPSSAYPGDQVDQVRAFTRQREFDFITWTWDAMGIKLEQMGLGAVDYIPQEGHSQIVLDYLELNRQIRQIEHQIQELYADPDISDPETISIAFQSQLDELNKIQSKFGPLAESILQNQLGAVLLDLELTLGGQPIPPVLYHVTPLPNALIVSPRDVIRQDANIAIDPEMTIPEQVALEEKVDLSLNVSSLVVGVGGIGLYPTMVMETSNINWLAEVVSHEWVHNFLTLRPLGASYGASPELRIINETVANLAEKEISAALIERYYPAFIPAPASPSSGETKEATPELEPPTFDFRTEMHDTRITTDALLAEGKIEEAEAYMEVRRQSFWEHGYQIRKLNQAYFAFYGAYADEPGGAAGEIEDPIGEAVRKLRAQSPSLAAFLNRISWIWSLEQLIKIVESNQQE